MPAFVRMEIEVKGILSREKGRQAVILEGYTVGKQSECNTEQLL